MSSGRLVRTQSMIFTLMGDYFYHEGEFAVRDIIKMMQTLGYTDQAVRSALSRMCSNNWLKNRRVGNKSYYCLTGKSKMLLDRGYHRIFFTYQRSYEWNGQWQILTYSIPEEKRNLRAKLRKELAWLGYGVLSYGCWISPYDLSEEIRKIVVSLGISKNIQVFEASFLGYATEKELVAKCWNLNKTSKAYDIFYKKYYRRFQTLKRKLTNTGHLEPAECFVERVLLIHEYRKFPFLDPGLPLRLLPDNWIGIKVAGFVQNYREWLEKPADEFISTVLNNTASS